MNDICQFVCSYRTPSGYCGSTGGYATCQHRKMDEPPTIKSAEPMTNADKYFRKATDEELRDFLREIATCKACSDYCWGGECKARNDEQCDNAWLNWLKQEAEESEN